MSKPSAAISGSTVGDAAEAAPRAREELVPGAEPGELAVDVDTEHGALDGARGASGPRAPAPRARHSSTPPSPNSARPPRARRARSAWPAGDLAVVLVEPARVGIDPCLDAELPGAEGVRRDRRLEVVVSLRLERRLAPAARSRPAGSGRRPRACRARRGRSSRVTVTVSPRHALTGKRPQSTCGWTFWIWIRCGCHPRQGKQSGDVAHPFPRRQPPSDLAPRRPARPRGVRLRRLARRGRGPLLAGAAAQSTRRARVSVRVGLGVRRLARPARRARAAVDALGAAALRGRERVLDRRLDRVRGRRRARRAGAIPA